MNFSALPFLAGSVTEAHARGCWLLSFALARRRLSV